MHVCITVTVHLAFPILLYLALISCIAANFIEFFFSFDISTVYVAFMLCPRSSGLPLYNHYVHALRTGCAGDWNHDLHHGHKEGKILDKKC